MIVNDNGADLETVERPSVWLVALHIIVWIGWAITTGLVALVGFPIVWLAVRKIDPTPNQEPFQFPRWARWWDSPVTTWPEPWWWGHQEQIERKLHKQHFDTEADYHRANLWHWRAVRNPRNYFSRMVPREDVRSDVVQTENSYNPNKDMLYTLVHHGDRYPTADVSYQRYRWDSSRIWLGYWHRIQMLGSRYIEFRLGFKLAHDFVGMGFTARLKIKRRHPD